MVACPPTASFNCTGCGDCCRVDGDVWLNGAEGVALAKELGLSRAEMAERYIDFSIDVGSPDGDWQRLRKRPDATAEMATEGEPEGGAKERVTDDGRKIASRDDQGCVFLRDGRCTVYGARPLQCSTYPFWPRILRSSESWAAERDACEGINAAGAPRLDPAEVTTKVTTWEAWLRRFPVEEVAALDMTKRWYVIVGGG